MELRCKKKVISESPSWIKFIGTWLTPSGEVKYDQSKFLMMLNKTGN